MSKQFNFGDAVETLSSLKKKVREAVANYMQSEGCSCCSNNDDHKKHKQILANILGVKKYSDGSGYDFSKYATKK